MVNSSCCLLLSALICQFSGMVKPQQCNACREALRLSILHITPTYDTTAHKFPLTSTT